jgi:hypothetical protein
MVAGALATVGVYPVSSLPRLPQNEGTLYFITSVGTPFVGPGNKDQQLAAVAMERLGGTYELPGRTLSQSQSRSRMAFHR